MLASNKDQRRDDLLLAAAQAGLPVSLQRKRGRQYPDEQRNRCDPAHRDGVRQVHRTVPRRRLRRASRDNHILPHRGERWLAFARLQQFTTPLEPQAAADRETISFSSIGMVRDVLGDEWATRVSSQNRRIIAALIALLSLSRICSGQLASTPVIAPAASTLTTTAQNVQKVPSTVALSLTTPTSIIFGQAIDGLAQITATDGSAVTGTVTFSDGATTFCTLALADGASCPSRTETSFEAGTHTFAAAYSGDATHAGAISNPVTVIVVQDTTTTALASSANPVPAGSSVLYTASVTGAHGPVTGTVIFLDGSVSMGSAALDANGAAALSSLMLTPGSHAITATYTGNANSALSTSPALDVVHPGGSDTHHNNPHHKR